MQKILHSGQFIFSYELDGKLFVQEILEQMIERGGTNCPNDKAKTARLPTIKRSSVGEGAGRGCGSCTLRSKWNKFEHVPAGLGPLYGDPFFLLTDTHAQLIHFGTFYHLRPQRLF